MHFYILSLLLFFSSLHIIADSLDNFRHAGASVLPITSWFKPKEGKLIDYVILTREAGGPDKGTYDDFGGKKEPDHKTAIDTAANEFWEEAILRDTLGWSVEQAKNYIQPSGPHTQVVIAKKGRPNYVTYITRFDNKDITDWRSKFHKAREKLKEHKFTEKDQIATVRWDDLAQAIKNAKQKDNVLVHARLIDPQTGKEKSSKESIKLRPKLVWVLKRYIKGLPYITGDNPKVRFYDGGGPKPPKQEKPPKPQEADLAKLLSEFEVNLRALVRENWQ